MMFLFTFLEFLEKKKKKIRSIILKRFLRKMIQINQSMKYFGIIKRNSRDLLQITNTMLFSFGVESIN